MSPRPTRRCRLPRCPNPARRGGLCPDHANLEQSTRRLGSIYDSARWKKLRRIILTAEPNCRRCGAPATDVDHVHPIEAGGDPWERHNLQALCHPCHSTKTASERRGPSSSSTSRG